MRTYLIYAASLAAAMVSGHIRQDLQLPALEPRQLAVKYQMITVLVMLVVIDQITDVLQAGRGFQRLAGGPIHFCGGVVVQVNHGLVPFPIIGHWWI